MRKSTKSCKICVTASDDFEQVVLTLAQADPLDATASFAADLLSCRRVFANVPGPRVFAAAHRSGKQVRLATAGRKQLHADIGV